MPAWLLKRFHKELAAVVHDIICASIVQSKYPISYKHALVSPVPKVDNPTLFNVHVNDIEDCIPRGIPVSTCKYAGDCTLYELVLKDSVSQMQDAVTRKDGLCRIKWS